MQHESPSVQAAQTATFGVRTGTLEIYLGERDAEMYERDLEFREKFNDRIQFAYAADVVYILGPNLRRIGKLFDCREIPF